MRFEVKVVIERVFDITATSDDDAERTRKRILNANKAEHRGSKVTVTIEQLPLKSIGGLS